MVDAATAVTHPTGPSTCVGPACSPGAWGWAAGGTTGTDAAPFERGRYDSSPEHVRRSVEASLTRLGTDHLDVLLVHRPDPLTDSAALGGRARRAGGRGAGAAGGVSNHAPAQLAALQAHTAQPLVVDQVQLSLAHRRWVEADVLVNTAEAAAGEAGTLGALAASGVRVQARGCAGRRAVHRAAASRRPAGRGSSRGGDRRARGRPGRRARHDGRVRGARVAAGAPGGHRAGGGGHRAGAAGACADAAAGRVRLGRDEWYALWTAARGGPLP